MSKTRVHLATQTESNFLISYKYGLWAKNQSRFTKWDTNDFVVFLVGKRIAGLARVCGKAYVDETQIFIPTCDGDVYKYRIPVKFEVTFRIEDRPLFLPYKKELLKCIDRRCWGYLFRTQAALPESVADSLLTGIHDMGDGEASYREGLAAAREMVAMGKSEPIRPKLEDDDLESCCDEEDIEDRKGCTKKDILLSSYIRRVNAEIEKLSFFNEEYFRRVLDPESRAYLDEVDFSTIQRLAHSYFEAMGLTRPQEVQFGKGVYIVVGDSHGYRTEPGVFKMLHTLISHSKASAIVHIGHLLDDDDQINKEWLKFDNLIVVAMPEEASAIEDFIRLHRDANFSVIRHLVKLGELDVVNQSWINDYTKTRIAGTGGETIIPNYERSTIVNAHRHEFDTRYTSAEKRNFISSPGCLCEPHVMRVVRKLITKDTLLQVVKEPWKFKISRRRKHAKDIWEQGLNIVEVGEDGRFTIIPTRIQTVKKGKKDIYATSYGDKIILEKEVVNPDRKVILASDMHVVSHDPRAIDIVDQFARDYKADVYINLGDAHNNDPVCHHDLKKGYFIMISMLAECAHLNYILGKMKAWAPERYYIFGNHERFILDYVKANPQFAELFDLGFLVNINDLGYELTKHKKPLLIGDVGYVHGDSMKSSRKNIAKSFFKRFTVIGHFHAPEIEQGCYVIGFVGQYDQEYNNPEVLRWCHGFGYVNEYNGVAWVTSIAISDYHVHVNGNRYTSEDEGFWDLPEYTARMVYDFGE